jgi:hypothetical protein
MFRSSWFNQKELITIRVYLTRAPLKDLNLCTLYRKIEKSKEQGRRQVYQLPPSPRYVANTSPATADREAVTQVGIPTRGLLKALANES